MPKSHIIKLYLSTGRIAFVTTRSINLEKAIGRMIASIQKKNIDVVKHEIIPVNGPVWITHDKRVIEIENMDGDHLRNIHAMLKRAGWCHTHDFFSALSFLAGSCGDGARDALEGSLETAKFSKVTDAIFDEFENRFGG